MASVAEKNGVEKKNRKTKKAEAKKPLELPSPEWVNLNDITFDDAFQMRENIPPCGEYAELLKACDETVWPFTPVVMAKIGGKIFMIEGFTRSKAAIEAAKPAVYGHVIECTKAEALKLAFGANSDHGFRRTNADKRKAVRLALAQWPGYTASKIADICRVSHTYVYNVIEACKGSTIEANEADGEESGPVASAGAGADVEYEDFAGEDQAVDGSSAGAVVEANPVDLRVARVEAARKNLGLLIRSLEEIGVLPKVEKHVAAISSAIK